MAYQQDVLNGLGRKLTGEFTQCESLRRDKEVEWVENLRQCKGKYDPSVRLRKNASQIYPRYTRSKEVPCVAKLNSMLFPPNDRNWDIEPTPNPKLTDEQIRQVAVQVMQQNPQASASDVQQGIEQFAHTTADLMRTMMDDQLTEIRFKEICMRVIRSGVRYGTGLLKGPLSESYSEIKLTRFGGAYAQVEEIKHRPYAEFVPIWYWYPDMTATEYGDCDYSFELHAMTKYQLRRLAKRNDFFGKVISEYIKAMPNGDYTMKNWEIDLRSITNETSAQTRKYQVLEYWGYIDGADLRAAGVDIPEDRLDETYWANVWLLGERVIKAILNPAAGDAKIYHAFYWEKDESSIFGEGLPRNIRDTQLTISAAARMCLDNGAITVGPQIEANMDLLDEVSAGEVDDVYPLKVWRREGRGADAQYPAVRALNFDSHIEEIITIIQTFKQFGDEESTMPALLFAESAGSNETARGMSIRSSNQNVTLGDIVKSFDLCLESFLTALHAWNMEFNPDPSIKGDAKIKASGVSSLMSAELRTQALDFFASTLTPADDPWIKRGQLLRRRAKTHDLDPNEFIRTDREAEEYMAQQRDEEALMLQKAMLMAEIDYTKSKAAHMYSKADGEPKKADNEAKRTEIEGLKTLSEMQRDENKALLEKEKIKRERYARTAGNGGKTKK